jgi:hypothetical protein
MSISLETVRDLAGQLSPRDQVRLITLLSAQLETVVTDAPAPSSAEAWTTYDQLRAEFAALPGPPTSAVAELSASRR